MMSEYFNPSLFPGQGGNLGSIVGMKDGQLWNVSQDNGVLGGAPLFIAPKSLVDGSGVYSGLNTEFHDLTLDSVFSLEATKISDGNLIFTVAMAEMLLPQLLGISYVTVDRTPPPTKTGWYDKNNPTLTRFGALNLTKYNNLVASVARDNIVAVQLGAALSAYPGDLITAAHALTTDFGKVAPILTRQSETNIAATSNDIILIHAMCVEVDSVTLTGVATQQWVQGTTTIRPNRDASVAQIIDTLATGNSDVIYKTWDLGLPLEMLEKIVLGKCVYGTGTVGEVIALEVW